MIPIGCGHLEPCPLATMFIQATLVGSPVGPSKYSRYIQELTSSQQYLIQSTNPVLNHGPTGRTTKSIVSKTSPIKVSVAYCIFFSDQRWWSVWSIAALQGCGLVQGSVSNKVILIMCLKSSMYSRDKNCDLKCLNLVNLNEILNKLFSSWY